jgi:hypothetical protein
MAIVAQSIKLNILKTKMRMMSRVPGINETKSYSSYNVSERCGEQYSPNGRSASHLIIGTL